MTEAQRRLLERPDILDLMERMSAVPAEPSPRGRPRRP